MCVEREQFCGLAKLPQIRHINYAQLLLEQSIDRDLGPVARHQVSG